MLLVCLFCWKIQLLCFHKERLNFVLQQHLHPLDFDMNVPWCYYLLQFNSKTFSELNKLEIIFLKSLCGILGPLIYNRRLEHGSKDPEETPQSSRESYSTSGRETTRDLSRCLLFLKFKKPLKQPPPSVYDKWIIHSTNIRLLSPDSQIQRKNERQFKKPQDLIMASIINRSTKGQILLYAI